MPDAVTSDGHVVTFHPLGDDGWVFCWDGQPGEPFALGQLRDGTAAIFASPDGAHLAYMATRGDSVFVGHDDHEEGPYETVSRSVPPVFSPGGAHLAYGAMRAGRFRLILDGQEAHGAPLAPIQAVFSPDGERLAFVEVGDESNGSCDLRIVLDGTPGPWFRGMRNADGAMRFSPDSRRFARYRIDERGHAQWIVDEVAQQLTNEVRAIGMAQLRGVGIIERPLMAGFSPDSGRFAYCGDVTGKGVAMIEDDVPGPLFRAIGRPVFSPDSRHLAYVAQTFGKTFTLVLDGVAGPEWRLAWLGDPIFSADSHHVACTFGRSEGFILRRRKTVGLVVDGRIVAEVEGDEAPAEPVFDPAGKHVAWWYRRDGQRRIMLDDELHTQQAIAYSAPLFTASGRLVHAAILGTQAGHVTVMVDGRTGPVADAIVTRQSLPDAFWDPRPSQPIYPFALSADGEHVAWAGLFGADVRPVIDGRLGPACDHVISCAFDEAGNVTWWAQRGELVHRVTVASG